jgi:hypothetical protein
MIESHKLASIVRRVAGAILDRAEFRRLPIADALDACRTSETMDSCVSAVIRANHDALISDMRGSSDAGYLIMTARVTESGVIDGMAIFVEPDGRDLGVTYMLEPLDAHQRPRRHLNEQRGRAEWFAADSTYLLQTAACDVAHRLGFAAAEKHIKIRAFDQQNGFDDGTIDWGGSAVVR